MSISYSPYKLMWWGYLHSNGTVQVKRWWGDHEDYIEDCRDNIFVQRVVPPFEAPTVQDAFETISKRLKEDEASKSN